MTGMGSASILAGSIAYISLGIALVMVGAALLQGLNTTAGTIISEELNSDALMDVELRIATVYVDPILRLPDSVEILNSGSIAVWNFENSQFIVELVDFDTGARKTLVLSYGSGFEPVSRGILDATTGTRIYYPYTPGTRIYPGETVVFDLYISTQDLPFLPEEIIVIFVYSTGDSASARYLT